MTRSFSSNLRGKVRNFSLPKNRPLIPLYEAVVNSINAIDERAQKQGDLQGKIEIEVIRERSLFAEADKNTVKGFCVRDNGVGFNEANMASFMEADSEYKMAIGGKGVGRFSWLKAFSYVQVVSTYKEDDAFVTREFRIPKCSVQTVKGKKYYRIQMKDEEGKNTSVSAKTEEEARAKYLKKYKEIEDAKFRKLNPTVAEYASKWLTMQSAHISPTTLEGYTNAMNTYIVKPLGDMYMSDVTADDIKMAMVPLAKRSSHTYATVNMLVKSLFNSAEYSNLISYNPTRNLNPRGGIPSKEREPLTDAQTELLLDTVRNLPPYVFVMIGLYAGMRREEILALKWDCVFLDVAVPYISVRRAWHEEKNRPVINARLKTRAAKRDIPIPKCLTECLRQEKERSISEYVIADSNGEPLSYSQFVRIWNYIKVRSTKERTLTRYVNGQAIKKKFKPELGQKCINREDLVYCLDFEVTPHQLRHTYITNLIHAGVDPKTVQYLAGHENSKVTMDIYAKVKYNKPEQLSSVVNSALKLPSSDREEEQEKN